ncbi:MAG TPA: methyltransferase [Balneolaceae bacterium]|nr:methyltransferase [Balneolaceae bacterium]
MKLQQINSEILEFIRANEKEDPASLILKGNIPEDWPVSFIAEQIKSLKKARKKIPELAGFDRLILPPEQNLEQASSEKTAKYKSDKFTGGRFVDLTGGSGIDTYYIGKNFDEIVYVESSKELCDLVDYNFNILGLEVDVVNTSAESFLESNEETFDLIYVDPSRRDGDNNRLRSVRDYSPNVIELMDSLLSTGSTVMIKISPMASVSETLYQLSGVYSVTFLSVQNELKEVLLLLKKGFTERPVFETVNLLEHQPDQEFKFFESEESTAIMSLEKPGKYLYDPNPSVMKSGTYNLLCERFGVNKLHANTHLYTSEELVEEFPGRVFEIKEVLQPGRKNIIQHFPGGIVNIATKNFPVKPNELKKKYRLRDGGDEMLYFCEIAELGKKAVWCIPLKNN